MFDRLLARTRMHRRSFRLIGMTAITMLAAFALAALYTFATKTAGARAATITVCASGCDHTTLQAAVAAASNGDTINVSAGTYVLASTVNVNVPNLTIAGAGSATTIFQVAQAIGNAFSISVAGVTLTDLQIQKTDVTGVHELILVNASGDNFTLQNSLIQGPDPGTPWSVNGIVSRALVSSTGGVTGLLIQNNTIKHLRQPAYLNPGTVGSILNNNVSGTRGWVVDGAQITFTGNTWGPPANQGADIALLASCNPADYPNLGALSNANGNAFISGQFVGASSGVGTVYVDDDAGPGGDGTQALPYQTIATGITNVLPGGIVNVAAGTYVENPTANKAVSLVGANAGTSGSATRVPESIVRTNGNQTAVFTVTASNVTVNGFTIDGDDPGLTGIALASGDDTNSSYAVRPTVALSNLTVSNNIIKKVQIGVRGDIASQGHVITQNWFDSIGHFDFGYCVSIRNNFYASVTNNKMTRTWTGVHINNHNGAGGPVSFPITGNEIHAYAGGILYWLQYNQATGATISGNTITAETGAVANNFGVLIVTNQDAVNSTFTSNTISGHDYGVGLFNVPTSNNITLGATNSISGSKLAGVFLTDNLNFNPIGTTNFLAGGPGAASTVNITGLSITGNVNTGVKVEGTANTQTLNMTGASIGGGVTGLLVTGAPTALTGNTLNNTAFSGQSGSYISLASSALDNLTINATAVTFDGLTGGAANLAQNLAIEDKITHAIDDPSLGFVRVKTGGLFVTANSFNAPNTTMPSIQRAIDLATAGESVDVGAGTFIEDVNVNKTLIVSGAGAANTTVSGAIGGAGSTFALTANNIELKGFKITREGNTVPQWNDPNLNSAGVSIQGQAITGANIHDNLITQNRSGIDINNSNGHTVRNNVITDNRTGLIFRNQTDNLTVVENEITDNWTVGIVFLDATGGTSNSPLQQALNCTFSNNNFSGNWYGQIVDRQSSAFIPTPGTTNLKNFSANWFGTNAPVVTTANSTEPGYAGQIPTTVPGGTATPPGGQPDIAGPASANFDLTPLLDVGTDTNVETTLGRGTFGFQGSFNVLDVIATNAQTGATGRIQEGINLVNSGGTVKVPAGTFTENVNVNKAATLLGTPIINGTLAASVSGATVSPGFSPGVIGSGSLSLSSGSILTIETVSNAGPGTGHDQLEVTGAVSLGGATLNLVNSFAPTGGTSFTIITNDGADAVSGTFNGLPEGTVFASGGSFFRITYAGGSNSNDVVLTAQIPPQVMAGATPSRQQGSPASNSQIALASDTEDAANTLSVQVSGDGGMSFGNAATNNGVTVTLTDSNGGAGGINPDAMGKIFADIAAACAASNASFTLKVTDSAALTATTAISVSVTANTPPVLTYSTPQNTVPGQSLMVSPATGPSDNGSVDSIVVQSVTPSTAPGTITVDNTTGVVTVPNNVPAGSYTVTIRATDNCGGAGGFTDASFVLNVVCPSITVNPATLANGFVGTLYNQALSATGGTPGYTFTLDSGTLPNGVSIVGTNLTGTPTATGVFNFTLKATDSLSCEGTRAYTVVISGTGLQFYPLAHPIRLVDTRSNATACQTPGTQISGGSSLTVPARGVCDSLTIPANAAAVTGNITTVGPVANGFLTVYPSSDKQPQAANSNYQTGQTLNNVFTVGLGKGDGAFSVFSLSTTDVVVDITGYFAPPGAGGLFFHPLPAPVRLLDTRPMQTACTTPGTPLLAGTEFLQQGNAICGIPASAVALVGNATTVGPLGQGFLTLFPADATRPLIASGNYQSGQTLNSPFTVGLSPSGNFTIYSLQQTNLVVDVLGYYSPDASDTIGIGLLFSPMTPTRLLDTRSGQSACFMPGVPIPATTDTPQAAAGECIIPATAKAIVGNATTVSPAAQGFLTFWPSDATRPNAATSNFAAGVNFNRHFTVGLGADGAFKIYALTSTHLVVDVSGSFAP